MKKIIALILVLVFVMSLGACGSKSNVVTSQKQPDASIMETYKHNSTLVMTFSLTGNTLMIANNISKALSCDTFQVEPETPYTDADIKTDDNNCRAKKEADDPTARPQIKGQLPKLDNYDTIFVGFPIWHDDAPRIIYTLFDQADFSGKNIFLFATSKTSSIQNAYSNIVNQYTKFNFLGGKRFMANTSEAEVNNWLKEIKIIE